MNEHLQQIMAVFQLGDKILSAARRPLYLSLIIANGDRDILANHHGWAGGEPNEYSAGSYYATAKHTELVDTINSMEEEGDVVLTPVSGYKYGRRYMGGVRRKHEGLYLITTCSGWKQRADALFALVLNYALTSELELHHVGLRYESEEALQSAVEFTENRYGLARQLYNYKGHTSFSFLHKPPFPTNFEHFVEHEYDPQKQPGIHWDFLTDGGLVDFVATHLEQEPSMTMNDVYGEVGELDTDSANPDGIRLSIMERELLVTSGRF